MHELAYCALDKVNLGALIIDQYYNIVFWNNWLVRWTCLSSEAMLGNNLLHIYPQFAKNPYLNILNNALQHGQSRFCSGALHKIFIPPAEKIQNNIRQNMLVEPINSRGQDYVLIQITDMTGHYTKVKELKNVIKEIESEYAQVKASEDICRYQALHDPLTGLPNRSLFYDRMDTLLLLAKRNKEQFAVVFLDLDGFKEVNDNYGHEAGDLTLQAVAKRMKQLLRESDTLARLGGDEFLLLFPSVTSRDDVVTIVKKILDDFRLAYTIGEYKIYLSASMGISMFPNDGQEAQTLIRNADIAMYSVKSADKNNFSFYRSL